MEVYISNPNNTNLSDTEMNDNIAMNILMDDAEGSESPFEGNSFMTS